MYSHITTIRQRSQYHHNNIILTYSHQHTFSTANTSRQVSTAVSCGVLRLTFTTTRPRILPAKIWEAAWCRSTKATYRDETWLDPNVILNNWKKRRHCSGPKDQKRSETYNPETFPTDLIKCACVSEILLGTLKVASFWLFLRNKVPGFPRQHVRQIDNGGCGKQNHQPETVKLCIV